MARPGKWLIVGAGLMLLAGGYWVSPGARWSREPMLPLRLAVVDYTVPFDDYKEHIGLFWVLNHARIPAPGSEDAPWSLSDYIGYHPDDRDHPVRLEHADPQGLDALYIADTYGVYRDDLIDPDNHKAHMDYNPVVFGGLSEGDVAYVEDFAAGGGHVIFEFNALCDPTDGNPRERSEALLGMHWSGWVGRVFVDPHDDRDVPWWLPRAFAEQHPDRELPETPILALVSREGRLEVFTAPKLAQVTPQVVLTEAGQQTFPAAAAELPYYYWFSLVHPVPESTVYARWKMPPLEGVAALLAELSLEPEPPLMLEAAATPGAGRRLYLGADFADVDFETGSHDSLGIIGRNASRNRNLRYPSAAPLFWNFYAPIIDQVLREFAAERALRG